MLTPKCRTIADKNKKRLGMKNARRAPPTWLCFEVVSDLSPSIYTFFFCGTDVLPGLDPMQSTPVPVSYTKYVTKHMSKIEMGESICTSETRSC